MSPALSFSDFSSGGERKIATMLFVDLSGFTELSLSTDPEVVRNRLKPLLDGLVHIAEMHGAWVSPVEGDGFMALFGVPSAHDDDPARAVAAADRMRRFAAARSNAPSVHMGIATGEIFAELVRGAWSINGAPVNLASRLCDVAEAGEILADDTCVRLAGSAVQWSDVRVVRLKGHREGVEVHVLDAVWESGDPLLETVALVGREAERRVLDRAFEDAVATHRSVIVTVLGEAGLGKSALITQWSRSADAQVLYGRARGAPFDVPFDPLVSAVRAVPALDDSFEIVESQVEDSHERLPALWQLVLGGAAAQHPHEGRDGVISAGFRALLQDLARRGPLVVCLDDLHDAGTDVLEWLEEVDAEPIGAPILFVLGARPTPDRELAGELLELGPLAADAAAELVATTAGYELSSGVLELLMARTGGNPLFLRESTTWLVEHMRGGGSVGDAFGAVERVPTSVRLVLSARLDSLPAEDKLILQAASVWGEEGPNDVLVHLVGPAGGRSHPMAERSGLFEVRGGRWRFSHALVREVAYASLPKRERATLHESLLDAGRINQSQRAFHSGAVLTLDIAEDNVSRDAITRRAVVETARHVRALFAVEARAARDAVAAASSVITAAETVAVDEVIGLLLLGSVASCEMGDFEEAAELAERALICSQLSHESSARPSALVALGRAYSRLRRNEESAQAGREALELLDATDYRDLSLVGRAHMVIGETRRYDSFDEWLEQLQFAFDAFTAASDFDGAGEAARVAYYLLSTTAGPEYDLWSRRARDLTESDDLRGRAWIARAEMYSELARGNYQRAWDVAEEASALAESATIRDIRLESTGIKIEAAAHTSRYRQAIDLRAEALEEMSTDDHKRYQLGISSSLAMARAGDVQGAMRELDLARALLPKFGPVELCDLESMVGDVSYLIGADAAAIEAYVRARKAMEESGERMPTATAELGLLRAKRRLGEPDDLPAVLAVATELRQLEACGWLEILLAIWPVDVEPLPGPVPEEALALRHERNGDWAGAAALWATLGVSEDLARALERSGEPARAADVRAILRAD